MLVTPALARQGNRFLRVLRVDEENEIHLEVPGSIHRQSKRGASQSDKRRLGLHLIKLHKGEGVVGHMGKPYLT